MIGLDFGIKKIKRSHMLKSNVKKKTNLNSKTNNFYSSLSKKEEYILEKTCLEKINNKFKCLCKTKSHHFPKLVSSNNGVLILSNCGVSINKYKTLIKNKEIDPINIKNLDKQLDCIMYNLKRNKIKHLDMCMNGKNLCISTSGIISVIDFNIACINNEYTTEKINIRLHSYGENDNIYEANMKKKIKKIIHTCM